MTLCAFTNMYCECTFTFQHWARDICKHNFFSGRGWARACWINIHTDRAGESDRHRCGAWDQHLSSHKLHLLHSHRLGNLIVRISFSLHLFGMLRSGMQKQVRTLTFITKLTLWWGTTNLFSRCMLGSFIIFLMVFLAANVAGIIYIYVEYNNGEVDALKQELKKTIHYYQPDDVDSISRKFWDFIQVLNCQFQVVEECEVKRRRALFTHTAWTEMLWSCHNLWLEGGQQILKGRQGRTSLVLFPRCRPKLRLQAKIRQRRLHEG